MNENIEQKMNVFRYTDYRQYLRDYYVEQKKRNTSYSYKVFANKAKLGSPNYLKLVIEGARRITDKSLPNFVRGLKLTSHEAEYFKTLVAFQEASDTEARNMFLSELTRIRDLNTRNSHELQHDTLEILKSWRHWAIREMILLDDFREDPAWIAARLKNKVTPEEAKQSLDLLKKVGLVRIENGKYHLREPLISTSDEIYSRSLRELHKQFIEQGVHSLMNDPTERREMSGLTIAVSEEAAKEIKQAIKDFRKEINRVFSKDKGNKEVYQLTLNFFPLTGQGGDQ